MKVIKVGLLGMGTVGSGVFEVLKNNAAEISRRAGCTIQIGRVVVRDPEEVRTLVGPDIPLSRPCHRCAGGGDGRHHAGP